MLPLAHSLLSGRFDSPHNSLSNNKAAKLLNNHKVTQWPPITSNSWYFITNTSPYTNLLFNAIHVVCIKNLAHLNICGSVTDGISLSIHVKPSNITDLHSLACTISVPHSPLHNTTKFKITSRSFGPPQRQYHNQYSLCLQKTWHFWPKDRKQALC